jgi:hypothetical protein
MPGWLGALLGGVRRTESGAGGGITADHPYHAMTEATAFLAGLPLMTRDRARIAHGNAERV